MEHGGQHIHFVTGRLAERAVRSVVASTAAEFDFEYSISVLPITVAALMTPKWLARHLEIPAQATRVVLPGHMQNDLAILQQTFGENLVCGPRDIRDLPMFFGSKHDRDADYGQYSTEIIAEINHADRLSPAALLAAALQLNRDGADVIDLGCSPGHRWSSVADGVKSLVDQNLRVSIDSFDGWEVAAACRAGASLVLSVNSSNRHAAADWGTEVVVIPDSPDDKKIFDESIDFLAQRGVPFRLDPILEPLGCGFTSSLMRYVQCRRDFPDARMMMGIGNITELTDSDSAGINVLLLGICQELNINSILTTQVINWARSSVRECDLARRLLHYACTHRIPPKHLDSNLVLLRDLRVHEATEEVMEGLARDVRDKNIRLFQSGGQVHAVSANVHVADRDPFKAMELLLESPVGDSINREHAFYLGFEMAKAMIAGTLSKQYDQDQPLNWGFLTQNEDHHRLSRPKVVRRPVSDSN